jgi:structural maintenance of chromosome 2
LICSSSDAAEAVAFHRDIMTRSVTLEGDVYNPSGTLTGGSRPSGQNVLQLVSELQELDQDIESKRLELQSLVERKNQLQESRDYFSELSQQLEIVIHKLTLARATMEKTDYCSLEREIAALEEKVTSLEAELDQCLKEIQEVSAVSQRLQRQVAEFENSREDAQTKIEKELKKVKKALEASIDKLAESRGVVERLRMEIDSLENEKNEILKQVMESLNPLCY